MKKIILCFLLGSGIFALNTSYGLSVHTPVKPAKTSLALNFRADALVKLSPKQFSELTGKKLNLIEKLSFKILKLKMKHDLKKDPNLTLQDYYGNRGKKKLGTGWVFLIVLGGGVLIWLLIAFLSSPVL